MTQLPTDATGHDARYLRHAQIEGFSQQQVSALRLLVIGAGAIGNEVIKNLVLLGVRELTVYDLDRVEVHNLTRSVLLREADIGFSKAQRVAARAAELDPNAELKPVDGDIHHTLTLQHVADADCVIGCTDNFEARIRINQLCLLTGTPWINTAIDARYGSVEVFPFGPVRLATTPGTESQPACYECTLPESVYARLAERRSCGGLMRAARAQQVMPTTTITASIVAALACNEALRLTGCDTRSASASDEPVQASRVFVDTIAGSANRSGLTPAQLCPCCGLLPAKADVIATCRTGSDGQAATKTSSTDTLLLSDAIVWHCACATCGPMPQTDALVGRRAADLTDAITICPRCSQQSVTVDIRDQCTMGELATQYATSAVPAVWGLADAGLIAFAGATPAPDDTPGDSQ